MLNLSIIIPSKNAYNLTECVAAILAAGETGRIVAVDDGLESFPSCCQYVDGQKPFVYARNCNIGINAVGDDDVVLLNDDALLKSPMGFTAMQQAAEAYPEYGLIGCVTNNAGNLNQLPKGVGLRPEPRMVCFIAVLIPRRTIEAVGLLDERFIGYGFDDDDYCKRVRDAGLKIGIHDGCFVDHKHLKSTFRGQATSAGDLRQNAEIYKRKWKSDNHGRPAA